MKISFFLSAIFWGILSLVNNKKQIECNNHNIKKEDTLPIFGDWQIYKFSPGYISEITDEEAKKYLTNEVILESNRAIVVYDTCYSPLFKSRIENSDKFFTQNYRMNKKVLNIRSDSIKIFSLDCKDNPKYYSENSPNFSYDFILINRNLMIVGFKGFIFYLERKDLK
jgi:hypothetical protein